MTCPRCRSGDIRRSRRRGLLEWLILRLLLVRPFRCAVCDRRFYAFTLRAALRPF
jgi:transposase-like protein